MDFFLHEKYRFLDAMVELRFAYSTLLVLRDSRVGLKATLTPVLRLCMDKLKVLT